MTPTTTEQARQQLIAKIRHANRPAAEQKAIAGLGLPLADKVEELTKERDEYKQRTQRLMTTLLETKKERDALAAAAKLALEALSKHGSPYLGHIAEYQQAEETLRQAGVQ